jgi:folate-binding Fe-S cluster repair protein YgfZ
MVEGAVAFDLARDVVRVSGPEALAYLQGQLSQDVVALPAGGSALSLLLEPTGKLGLLLRVTRVADDDLLLDTTAGWGDRLTARLQRFRLRTRADIEPVADRRCIAVRGPRAHGWRPKGSRPTGRGCPASTCSGPTPGCPTASSGSGPGRGKPSASRPVSPSSAASWRRA